VTVRNLDLTKMSLRLLVRRKATRGTDVNTLVQRGEEDTALILFIRTCLFIRWFCFNGCFLSVSCYLLSWLFKL